MRLCFVWLLLCVSALSQTQVAQETTDPSSVVQQSLAAMGATGSALMAVHGSGILHKASDGTDSSFDLYIGGPNQFRLEVEGSAPFVQVFNSDDGYVVQNGKRTQLSYNESFGQRCPYLPLYSHLLDKSVQVSASQGQAKTTSGPFIRFRHLDSGVPELAYYFDADVEFDSSTLLPIRLQTRLVHSRSLQMGAFVEYLYSAYTREGPYLLPHTVEMRVDTHPYITLHFAKFEFNPTFAADSFKVR